MGIFSLFRKQKRQVVYQSIAQKIVTASLRYRDLFTANDEATAEVGAEMAYFLLHVVDRTAFDLYRRAAAGHCL